MSSQRREEETVRSARIKAEGAAHYHCMSRVIDGQMWFGDQEKERFCKLMRLCADFCGVNILTHSVLSNHFHLLTEVPQREQLSDRELLRRLALFYPKEQVKEVKRCLKAYRDRGEDHLAEREKQKYAYRMYDVSEFMKTLKQRYTQWFNRRRGRKGTLWEDRFKSLLVENSEFALSTMAAYIDLNAVRAGIVKDPKDYRYCGYAEAVVGKKEAREGMRLIMKHLWRLPDGSRSDAAPWRKVSRAYRQYLYMSGEQKGVDEDGRAIQAGFSREQAQKVLDEGGKLSHGELLRCRVRYFSDGVALGSEAFVDEVFRKHRGHFGAKRTSGARKMTSGEWGALCTLRDLRLQPVSVPARPG